MSGGATTSEATTFPLAPGQTRSSASSARRRSSSRFSNVQAPSNKRNGIAPNVAVTTEHDGGARLGSYAETALSVTGRCSAMTPERHAWKASLMRDKDGATQIGP